LERVAKKVVPTSQERGKMTRLSGELREKIETILAGAGIAGAVSEQGSFARDTWLRGEADLDIFTRFSPDMERGEWEERVLPVLRKGLSRFKVTQRYAEHPFLEFHVDKIRVNVVPCYDVKKGEWKSATDRTPYHTEYMKRKLTEELRLQARLLKKFVKGIGTYGAEIRVGGFSGMLIDSLVLHYGSLLETLTQASKWAPGLLLEIEPSVGISRKEAESKFDSDLVVIDPVDPHRNLAAAVRPVRLWNFVAAGREFLRQPGLWYFFPSKFTAKTKSQFAKRVDQLGRELIAISFKHQTMVMDVLWGQLMKLERSFVDMMAREDFRPRRSEVWTDEKRESAILVETDGGTLPVVKTHQGPPVWKEADSRSFLDRHISARDTVRGPRVEGDRWLVEKKRQVTTARDLLQRAIRDKTYGLALPKQLEEAFPRTARVLRGRGVLALLGKNGFDKVLWEFLEAKPSWLRTNHS
jgi:tRNA nucleotidyltransferase (CCA-adding enzyme)